MNPIWNVVSVVTAGMVFTRHAPDAANVYLTFDDGPHPEHTPPLLELLARYDARATFFMLGASVKPQESVVRQVVAAGHTWGNHSYSHPSFVNIPMQRQAQEIDRTNELLASFDGRPRHLFRPPRGRPALGTLALCLRRRHRIALWTHDSCDYALDRSQVVKLLAGTHVVRGDILLFHDDGGVARAALETLLPLWQASGLKFAAL